MYVTFLHPDLGIGGAERLVVDAALALKKKKMNNNNNNNNENENKIDIITCHHDPNHCFPETTDGTLDVISVGDWLPRSIFGKCMAFCAYIRMIFAAFYLCLCRPKPDIVFCDQISACLPVIRLLRPSIKLLFYCHFPDQLLTERENGLKRAYRYPLDFLEQWSTGLADCVCVNSNFTAEIFRKTFTNLQGIRLEILYPSLNSRQFDQISAENKSGFAPCNWPEDLVPSSPNDHMFLSLNRFERKKNIALAIRAFDILVKNSQDTTSSATYRLVIAGGYDPRLRENVEHFQELESLVNEFDLNSRVTFVRSPSDPTKLALIEAATAVLYTPTAEHFGIVPLEAMYLRCPVIAVSSGGPNETIDHGLTGFLLDPNPEAFAAAMLRLTGSTTTNTTTGEYQNDNFGDHQKNDNNPDDDDDGDDNFDNKKKREGSDISDNSSNNNSLRSEMGNNGRKRVMEKFSFEAFAAHLDAICQRLILEE